MLREIISRGWDNFLARPAGPLNLRFILQPAIGILMAIRAGWKDAKKGRPAYLWAASTNPAHRREFLHGGWKDMRSPFLMSIILDAVYQTLTQKGIFLLELLFTATLLTLVPYVLFRGPVNRIAQKFLRRDRSMEPGDRLP